MRVRSGHPERIRSLHLPEKGKILSLLEGHRAVVEAIAAGDEDAAVAAIRDHLSRTIAKVEELRSDFPHCFA